MIMFYVYVLSSARGNHLYVGLTNNLRNRVAEHNQGLSPATKPYCPWRLVYYEACLTLSDAERREQYLKTTQGRRLLYRRLKDYMYQKAL